MQWIDEIIMGLIDRYETTDPYELCEKLNIFIIKVESSNIMLHGDPSLYIRNFYGKEVIIISDNLRLQYEMFYLRHELGHAILHTHVKNSLNKNLLNSLKLEKQADYFALKLSNIKFDKIQMYEMTIEQIASCVEIPPRALKQLVNL
ncbi:PTS N-acetylglucosamine transporter subunit IIABC [Clostridium novyi A str. 4540]|nr:PTS N-acetylglucosamine transporter subunit IIABC [Clostridium novyi A str. 4540]